MAKIAALIDPERRAEAAPSARLGAGEIAYVRADLAAQRAEGGERGIGEGAGRLGGTARGAVRGTTRRLACSLPVRP
ncbi:hypothetical protein BE04_38725 [Sorangium cellulosum]|uniref:Uncharacterized protein n=1 Tax=Sorangium cellulosum TaxID=56 RepID=A0A150PU05_SORCE|nr:hypothetical protein BE04_38725 [Sorangium cellulosum]